jgi:hypothetical protein
VILPHAVVEPAVEIPQDDTPPPDTALNLKVSPQISTTEINNHS